MNDDEWEVCNGYAIDEEVDATDASAATVQLAYEYDGLQAGENDMHLCQRLDDVKKLTPAAVWEKKKSRRSERRETASRPSETDATRSL